MQVGFLKNADALFELMRTLCQIPHRLLALAAPVEYEIQWDSIIITTWSDALSRL